REQAQVSASVARDNAAAQAADARRQVNAQLTQQLAALSTAYVQIGIAGANVVAAIEALRVQQERYRVGAGTQLDEVTAEANLTQAEVNRVRRATTTALPPPNPRRSRGPTNDQLS